MKGKKSLYLLTNKVVFDYSLMRTTTRVGFINYIQDTIDGVRLNYARRFMEDIYYQNICRTELYYIMYDIVEFIDEEKSSLIVFINRHR